MGKRQHQKDKMYLTCTEWKTLYGGKDPATDTSSYRRLPLDHCCITLKPFENPYCDSDGNIFDLDAVITYYKKYKVNPVTGKPMDPKKLTRLVFHKNAAGEIICPILFKSLTTHSHVVAIATTGNVFSHEAVAKLNIKAKYWKDLFDDTPFQKSDIITLQDPSDIQKANITNFHHIKKDHSILKEETSQGGSNLKTVDKTATSILKELERDYKPSQILVPEQKSEKADKFNAAHFSTGAVAASFTSTTMGIKTTHEPAILHEDEVRYAMVKKKGYVRIFTSVGPLNVELHCEMTPRACENFITLCKQSYYKETKFHRSIRHFMIQGGDPTHTGTGGQSIWGKPFKDEFKPNLTHSGRGILSMANSGPNTNKSQFFITYRSCQHLDGKHTVFGRVVGGLDTLSRMEAVEVDNKSQPVEDIIILDTEVFVDPFEEADDKLAKDREMFAEEMKPVETSSVAKQNTEVQREGIGRYICAPLEKKTINDASGPSSAKKRKALGYEFGDFSHW